MDDPLRIDKNNTKKNLNAEKAQQKLKKKRQENVKFPLSLFEDSQESLRISLNFRKILQKPEKNQKNTKKRAVTATIMEENYEYT